MPSSSCTVSNILLSGWLWLVSSPDHTPQAEIVSPLAGVWSGDETRLWLAVFFFCNRARATFMKLASYGYGCSYPGECIGTWLRSP